LLIDVAPQLKMVAACHNFSVECKSANCGRVVRERVTAREARARVIAGSTRWGNGFERELRRGNGTRPEGSRLGSDCSSLARTGCQRPWSTGGLHGFCDSAVEDLIQFCVRPTRRRSRQAAECRVRRPSRLVQREMGGVTPLAGHSCRTIL